MLLWYTFNQNNSGGFYRDPAQYVFIQASSTSQAMEKAEKEGLYFDGAGDCSCCGDRWYRCTEGDGNQLPRIYGMTPAEHESKWSSKRNRGVPLHMFLFATGLKLVGSSVDNGWDDSVFGQSTIHILCPPIKG